MSDIRSPRPAEGAATPGHEDRRERRRIGALLNAYYGIEEANRSASSSSGAPPAPEAPLDHEGFDAKRHFDSIVEKGLVADVVKSANEIDSEVRDLDGDMNMVVYENYSKFIRSMEVTKQMKTSVEEMEPDLKGIEGSFSRISQYQRSVEEGVSGRAGQIEALLKQQRICKKLQILFDLPQTLQRCLAKRAYGQAVQAYCSCSGFLRQHKDVKTLQNVLQEVEHQMGKIRVALEQRLRSSELSVDEAVNCAVTLLDLGQEAVEVERSYFGGRAAALRASAEVCFALSASEEEGQDEAGTNGDSYRASSSHLRSACVRSEQSHVPELTAVVDGFRRMREGREATAGSFADDAGLASFVSARVHDLLERITDLVETKRPPVETLVACVTSLKEAFRQLQELMPTLMTKLLSDFTCIVLTTSVKVLSTDATANITADFVHLHSQGKELHEEPSAAVALDALIDHTARAEQSLTTHCLSAVNNCRALAFLAGPDRPAGQRLARGLQDVMIAVLLTFAKVCWAYCGQEPSVGSTVPAALRATPAQMQDSIGELEWVGFFTLALVWIGRRWEERVVSKVIATARELLAGLRIPGSAERELTPEAALVKATQAAAEAAMAHYVLVSGHHIAGFLRATVQGTNWLLATEPSEPSSAVETVFKELNTFDGQLARILGDPRKPHQAHRRVFSDRKTSMELELEWMMAKKLPAFSSVPFTRKGAVAAILRIAFKALYEYVRESTFGKFGLQQMQVDTALLSELTRDFVDADDANTLGSVLGEVVHSASQRCVEPVLMDERTVETLCDRKKIGMRLEQ